MERNEVLQQIIDTVRTDILSNKKFLESIFEKYKIKKDNIDPNLIIDMMAHFAAQQEVRRPVSNNPKDIIKSGKAVAKPVIVEGIVSKIVSDLLEGNNVYLLGKAGTGKTYLAEAVAKSVLGQPVYMINCSQWTSPIEIRGGQTIEGYQEGLLIEAWAKGGVLILDELPKLDPNTAGLLNAALAEAAAQPKYDENGVVIESTIPTLTNGRGDVIKKGQDQSDDSLKYRFCVIATGNTDMMNVGNKYSGNNRQDYSLVDRFAGSYYTLEQNTLQEMKLTYPYVFNVCNAIRQFLNEKDAIQSISLRTMLNFNRTYEQQNLYDLSSPFADEIFDNNGALVAPKSIDDSIESFLSMLEKNMRKQLEEYPLFKEAKEAKKTNFIYDFCAKYHLDPKTGETVEFKKVTVGSKEENLPFYLNGEAVDLTF
jgi:hypothetical protein